MEPLGQWKERSHIYPREYPSTMGQVLVEGERRRIRFVGYHSVDYVGRLKPVDEAPRITRLDMVKADHARIGNASSALAQVDGEVIHLQAGDRLRMAFEVPAVPNGMARDYFLSAHGVYTSTLPEFAPVTTRVSLLSGRPNPFATATSILFELGASGKVRLDILDLSGRRVRTLANMQYEAGTHSVEWDGTNARGERVSSGVYICRIVAAGLVDQRTIVFVP